jgi:hypothetical protein
VSCCYQNYTSHLFDEVERNFNYSNNFYLCYYLNIKKRKPDVPQ